MVAGIKIKNLEKQIAYEDAKAERMRRERLSAVDVQEKALNEKPTNDATFLFDEIVLQWRERVEELSKVVFWDTLNPKMEYKKTWRMARKALIHIDAISMSK